MMPLERKLRIAGVLLILGLVVTIGSLVRETPLSFMVCIAIGGVLTLAGIVLYLYSLVSSPATR